jgi:hypothetical protein
VPPKVKNPKAPAVTREAEEDWSQGPRHKAFLTPFFRAVMEHPFIKSVAKIAYAEDSSRAIVTFTTDNGVVTYQFSIFDLQTIVGAMSQMVLFAQSQTLSMGYHFVTPVLDLADAMAAPVADKNKVVLSVKLQNGIVCEFGLEPFVANRLREDMERAAKTLQDRPSHSQH